MAGRPQKQLIVRELEQRTREEFPDEPDATHLDLVEHWQASGNTLNQLGEEIGLGADKGETISRYLRKAFGAQEASERLTRARTRGADRLIDRSMTIADKATADDVNVARLRVQTLQWTAERWNRELAGKGTTNVSISFGSLHLAALMKHGVTAHAVIDPVITETADVVSIEDATTCELDQPIGNQALVPASDDRHTLQAGRS